VQNFLYCWSGIIVGLGSTHLWERKCEHEYEVLASSHPKLYPQRTDEVEDLFSVRKVRRGPSILSFVIHWFM
jgi:hypothetical protein